MEYSTTVRLPFLDGRSLPKLRDGDNEKRGYKYAWRLFTQVADSMGVKLTTQDIEHWRTILGITRGLDDMIDEEGCDDIRPALSGLFEGKPIGPINKKEAVDFKKCMANYPEEEQQRIAEDITMLGEFAKNKSQASSPNNLINITKAEAKWYTSLLELRSSGHNDSGQRREFNEWLGSFIASGYLVDGFLDIKGDFDSGNILVEPSLGHRKALAGVAIRESLTCLRKTPKRRLGAIAYFAYRYVYPVKSKHPA